MTLAAEYRSGGEACRERAAQLRRRLRMDELTESERIELRRRAAILTTMARDATAVSNYLKNYYREEETK